MAQPLGPEVKFVGNQFLNQDWGAQFVDFDVWDDCDQSFGGGKPEPAIAASPTGWLRHRIAHGDIHPVAFAVGNAGNDFDASAVEGIQIRFADAKDAALTAHPQPAMTVFQHLQNFIIKQSLLSGVGPEMALPITAQS